MIEIILVNGGVALVDDEFAHLTVYRWRRDKHGYARATVRSDGKVSTLLLHRLVLGVTDARLTVDHVDRNRLDDRRANLRIASVQQNGQNSGKGPRARMSRFKGVERGGRWTPGQWRGRITIDGRLTRSEWFDAEIKAARWYDEMAVQHFGAFAKTNAELGLFTKVA